MNYVVIIFAGSAIVSGHDAVHKSIHQYVHGTGHESVHKGKHKHKQKEKKHLTPVQKVIMMMKDMKTRAVKEKQDEEIIFTKFSQWCKNTASEKAGVIASNEESIETISAEVEKYDSDARVLGEEILALGASITTAEEDKKTATNMRAAEHADYEKTHADYVESIVSLEQAVTQVTSMMKKTEGMASGPATSLLQSLTHKSTISSPIRHMIISFLAKSTTSDQQMTTQTISISAPEAKAFESQSGGIVDMMTMLQDKLSDEKDALEKQESDARHTFDMMAQSLTDQIEQQSSSRTAKASDMRNKQEASGAAAGDLADAKATLESDKKYLEEVKKTCDMKAQDYETRQGIRAGEVEALTKAVEIITSKAVSGAADTHLPSSLAQEGTALVQLRSNTGSRKKEVQTTVSSFLEVQARRINSQILLQLASRVEDDPFKKVSKMIKDMIIKLTEAATEEAEHKGFCDTELATNKQTRDFKATEAAELAAEIEKLSAQSKDLAEEIATLGADISALDDAMAEATATRQAEKDKNTQTIADAKAASSAVTQAMAVLNGFYTTAAESPALLETNIRDMPETFETPYTGQSGSGGLLSMLQVIMSDFERLKMESTGAEHTAESDYQKVMADSAQDKAVKDTMMTHKKNAKIKTDASTLEAQKSLKSTNEELDAALAYFEQLKPSCIDAGESYEERVARRKEEISSLQEAAKILSGEM